MPLKDLGDGLSSRRVVGASLEETFRRARKAVLDFGARGLEVTFLEEDFPLALLAELTDEKGTCVIATVELLPDGDNTELFVALAGRLFVGGLEGALATPGRVRAEAQRRLEGLLEARFADLPEKPRRFVPRSAAPLVEEGPRAAAPDGSFAHASAPSTPKAPPAGATPEATPTSSTSQAAPADAQAARPAETPAAPKTPRAVDDERRAQIEEAWRAGLLSDAERDALLARQ